MVGQTTLKHCVSLFGLDYLCAIELILSCTKTFVDAIELILSCTKAFANTTRCYLNHFIYAYLYF